MVEVSSDSKEDQPRREEVAKILETGGGFFCARILSLLADSLPAQPGKFNAFLGQREFSFGHLLVKNLRCYFYTLDSGHIHSFSH